MKTKFLLIALFVEMQVFAEMSLVVYPLSKAERVTALAAIGYVRLQHDSMFIYSNVDLPLGQNRLVEVRKVTYEDRCIIPAELEENTPLSSLLVYPNPTHDALIINNANTDVARVFNMNGQLILTSDINGVSTILDVSLLPQGTYLLQLNTELVKFIKQ